MSRHQDKSPESELEKEKTNTYASQKSVSQNLLNTSIIQSHIGLLIYVFSTSQENTGFGQALIALIVCSLILQLTIFLLLTFLLFVRQDFKKWSFLKATYVNAVVTAFSGIALIINIAITTLSVEVRNND